MIRMKTGSTDSFPTRVRRVVVANLLVTVAIITVGILGWTMLTPTGLVAFTLVIIVFALTSRKLGLGVDTANDILFMIMTLLFACGITSVFLRALVAKIGPEHLIPLPLYP